jgi:hypothetical protein
MKNFSGGDRLIRQILRVTSAPRPASKTTTICVAAAPGIKCVPEMKITDSSEDACGESLRLHFV